MSGGYHDSLWQAVPEGLEPEHALVRERFLLDCLSALARELPAPAHVLDVGCGEGHFTARLQAAGARVLGVDVSREALRRARARHPGLELAQIPIAGEWPLDDASFDLVWAGETIEHVADMAGWLSQARRVLRARGMLVLTTPNHARAALLALALSRRRFERHFDPRGDHLRFFTRSSLSELLADLGFEQIEVHGAVGAPWARQVLLACARRTRW